MHHDTFIFQFFMSCGGPCIYTFLFVYSTICMSYFLSKTNEMNDLKWIFQSIKYPDYNILNLRMYLFQFDERNKVWKHLF